MNITHEETKTKITEIYSIMKKQAEAAKSYKQNLENIVENNSYSEEYKNGKTAELKSSYTQSCNDAKTEIKKKLEEIMNTESKNEAVFTCDTVEYANTINTITAAHGKLPDDVINAIKINFAGQYLALKSIGYVFKHYGVDLELFEYDEYTRKAEEELRELISCTEDIKTEETTAILNLRNIFKRLIRFAEVRGISFGENEMIFDDDIIDEEERILTRKAMGL